MAENADKPNKDDKQALAELEKQLAEQAKKRANDVSSKEKAPRETSSEGSSPVESPAEKSKPTANVSAGRVSGRNSRGASSQQKSRTGALWAMTFLNLLLIVALAAAGYWGWMQWQLASQNQTQFVTQQRQLVEQQSNTTNRLDSALESQRTQVNNGLATLTNEMQQVAEQARANSRHLSEVSGRRPSDWLLAEADYLVRMAGRKLWLERDVNTAILMLQSADSRLQDLADPSLLPVRQLIADDLQSLQQLNPVSLTSVALSLSAMAKQADKLPLALPEIPPLPEQQSAVSQSVSDWRENLGKAWQYFNENLVRYQPNTQAIRPLLTREQQWIVKEQLSLLLLQAQTAVLSEQAELYAETLQQADQLLVAHYDMSKPQVLQFQSGLNSLIDTNIDRQFPAQLTAAQPLQDLLRQRVDNLFGNREAQ